MTRQPLAGEGLLINEDRRPHLDTPHSVGLLWTGDQPDAETLIWQHTTLTTDRYSCLRRDSNPHSQAEERPQTHALDHMATGIDKHNEIRWYIFISRNLIINHNSSVRADFLQPDVSVTYRRTDKNGFKTVGFLIQTDSVDRRQKTSSRARAATNSSVIQVSVFFRCAQEGIHRRFWKKNLKVRRLLCVRINMIQDNSIYTSTRVGTLIVATIYLQLIQNRYMFRSFIVLQCSHQHCVQPVASDVEVVGYL